MVLGAYTGNIIEQAEHPARWYWRLIQVILFNKLNALLDGIRAYTGNIIEQAEQPDRWYWGLIQVILLNKLNTLLDRIGGLYR